VDYSDQDLQALIATGKNQGYLTYDQVNAYLPDEAVSPEKLDNLLIALDERGIELVDEAPAVAPAIEPAAADFQEDAPRGQSLKKAVADSSPKWSEDPIRLYLAQMAEIPLLTREQEISLAKKIEVTRKRFRRSLLSSHYALHHTVETLKKVHQGLLPFDRTIKVSLTEQLTKEQILQRMPHNLATLERLMKENRADFKRCLSKQTTREDRRSARRRFLSRRRKALTLV
jgi:RNA polymerase primary sigma factor